MAQKYNQVSALDLAVAMGRNIDYVNGTGRPSHLIDPRKKDKAWTLEMVKSIESDFRKYCPNLFFNNRLGYTNTVNAIQGIQAFSKYKNLVDQNISHNTDLTSLNLNPGPLQLMSKYFRHLVGRLNDVEFDISVKPNNSLAREQEDEYRTLLKTFMELSKILENNNVGQIEDFIGQAGFEVPDNNEELEIQMQMSKPSQLAMFLKRCLREISRLDKNDQKFSEADYNLVAFGASAVEVVTNQNGIPIKTVIDPRDLLVGFSNTEDARDVSEIGKYRMATINDIKEECKGELSQEDLKDIESSCLGKYGNDYSMPRSIFSNTDDLWGKYRTLVLDVYFYSYDEEVKIAKKDKNGNPRVLPKPHGYYNGREDEYKKNHPDKTLYRACTQNVYKASWIVGTDYIWNCGLVKNVSRPSTDIFKAELPISLICPLIKNGRTVSIIEEMITVTERANRFWMKMEEALATARPNGFELNIDAVMGALAAIPADQNYNFERMVQEIIERNIVLTSTKGMGGIANGAKPFTPLYGGLGPDFEQYFNGLQGCIQLLQEISGFGGAATGTPAKYTGKKVAELAIASADYSIKHLFRAKKTLYENTMKATSRLLIDSIMYGDSEVLRNYVGSNAFDFIKDNANAYECTLMIEFRASQEEWQDIRDAASIALKVPLAEGGIAYPDYIKVMECETIEEAEQLMRLLYNKNIKKAQQQQQQAIESNGEQQRMSAQANAQAQQQQLEAQLAHEKTILNITTMADLDKMKVQFLYDIELKKVDGLIKGDHIETQGEIDKEITDISAKYNMDRLKQKEPVKKK